MLRSLKDMEGYSIGATDGAIGEVRDFYFDDESWVIRYLVVETDEWHANKRVLISPLLLGRPDWSNKKLPASITQSQVRGSPDIDTDKPVSRQHEMGYLGYYGYGNYWGGGGLWGGGLYPDMLQGGLVVQRDGASAKSEASESKRKVGMRRDGRTDGHEDPHLRSGNAVMRYYVHASDGDIGHVQGILIDERSWAIHYVVVNTSNWWLGHQVLIAPQWIDHIDWAESKLVLDLTRQSVKDAPLYDPNVPFTLERENILQGYYGHIGYASVARDAHSHP
jgi:sporulation protein YlmC with PRC-barrel domain